MTWLLLPGLRSRPPRRRPRPARGRRPAHRGAPRRPAPSAGCSSELAHGSALSTLDAATATALDALVRAGLVVPSDAEAARADRRAGRTRVHLDVPEELRPAALRLLDEAGLGIARATRGPTSAPALERGRAVARAGWTAGCAAGTPHLVVRETAGRPGARPLRRARRHRRACAASTRTPARPTRAARSSSSRSRPRRRCGPRAPDPVRRALALAWAVQDLVTGRGRRATRDLVGDRSRSATLPPVRTAYRRHLHCGCAWADRWPRSPPIAAAG